MRIRIVQAGPSDAPIVTALVGELLQEIMGVIGTAAFGFSPTETEARAQGWLTDGTYTVLLARDGKATLGFLALTESRALYAEGTFGTIPELYVRPAFRSRKVGALLVGEAKRLARSRGWTRLEVTTPPLPQFERTFAFYEREGFGISGGRKMKADLV
jgi:GNAT superfamily N-acetyltransferase